jgi:CHAD domain-containing protein
LLSAQLSEVEQRESALPEKTAVHEMRVATRRLRAALRVLRLKELDPHVKRLQDALGKVRDLQLQVDWLDGRDLALRRARAASLRKAEQALARELRRWRSEGLPALFRVSGETAASSRKVAKMLRKRLARLEERLERARRRLTPQALHRARISVKQVRYLLAAAKSLPKKAISLRSDLKTRATLGELHDVDVRIDLLKRNPALLGPAGGAQAAGKIAAAQLERWHARHLVERAGSRLSNASVLAEDLAHRVGDLAQRRARLHGLDDPRDQVLRALAADFGSSARVARPSRCRRNAFTRATCCSSSRGSIRRVSKGGSPERANSFTPTTICFLSSIAFCAA